MSKSAKQLGIPAGYRLSQSNIDNITKVSIRHKFGEEMIALAHVEATLFKKVSAEVYTAKDLEALEAACRKIIGNNEAVTRTGDEQYLYYNSKEHQLGGHYASYSTIGGVISLNEFKDMLDAIPPLEFQERFSIIDNNHANSWAWRHEYCSAQQPYYSNIHPSSSVAAERLKPKTMSEVRKHFTKVKKLTDRIVEHITLVKGLTSAYTSAVKLCNDASEFVAWINDAKIYNKNGRKCTDVSTHDMIAKLKKSK